MRRSIVALSVALTAFSPTAIAETPLMAWLSTASLCRPGAGSGSAEAAAEPSPVRLTGFGVGGFAVSDDPEAQAWFDQGMATAFAFSHRETLRAFEQARRVDPTCGMCAWGEALALAPTINFGVDADNRRRALAALDAAAPATGKDAEVHAGLIAAARLRFAAPDDDDRAQANQAYARAMEALAARFPDDDAVAVMTADALMIARDFGGDAGPSSGGGDNADLRRAQVLLERVMARSPDHTGALHFYIHLTEWLDEAGLAEAAADRLGALAPAAGHLVHMPSHTYGRIGRFRDAAIANRLAVEADVALARATWLEAGGAAVPYHGHNLHFRIIAALAAGDRQEALAGARDMERTFPLAEQTGFGEVRGAAILFVQGRYATLQQIDALPLIPADRSVLRTARHYAAGEAAARLGDRARLRREIQALTALERAAPLQSPPRTVAELTRLVLEGREAGLQGRWIQAADAFGRATAVQARIGVAGDPPAFWFNTRRAQGQALLQAGRTDEAAATLERALQEWPGDAIGLAALAEAHGRAGREAEYRATWVRAYEAWAGNPEGLRADGV